MSKMSRSVIVVALAGAIFCMPAASFAQSSGEQKQDQKQSQSPGDAAKEEKRKIDEFAEAARVLSGAAGQPECVWTGRRAVTLLWRDDLDTAFRHLDLYDRFGCPGAHIQNAFRCLVRQGNINIDPKAPESINARVHACWINPNLQPQAAAAPGAPAAAGQPPAPAANPAGSAGATPPGAAKPQ